MRQIVFSMVVILVAAAATVSPVFADPALTFILQAFAAEERTPKKHAKLIFRRDDTEMLYIFDRVLPDRLHMYMHESDNEQELIIIGDRMYEKNQNGWVSTPAVPQLSKPFSIVGLFENRLENVKEKDPVLRDGVEQRVFVGTITWFAGRSRNQGEIRVFIETESVLPRLMTFKGKCGQHECSFEHTITFDPKITIEAPVP